MVKIPYKSLNKKPNSSCNDTLDYQTLQPKIKIPWKGISLAVFLSTTGFGLLMMGILSALGWLDQKYDDRTSAFFMLGTIMFIPGAYHVRIAYLAYMGSSTHSYEDIPDFD